MTMSSSSRILLLSAVLLLLVQTSTARYFEQVFYNDASCEDVNSTTIVDGIFAQTGESVDIQAFGECTVLTGVSDTYGSSMFECTDNEATVSFYEGDSCSGEAVSSRQTTNSACSDDRDTSRCTEESDWSILTDWVVSATFYSNADCSTASGKTGQYTMAEVMELAVNGTCQEPGSSFSFSFSSSDSPSSSSSSTSPASSSSSSSIYAALRCVDGYIGLVTYDGSDATCSGDFTMASIDADNCETSIFEEGPYARITCASDFDSASFLLAGGGGAYAWSIAAATTATVLAAVFG